MDVESEPIQLETTGNGDVVDLTGQFERTLKETRQQMVLINLDTRARLRGSSGNS